jgi:hypothetical protein
LFGIEFFMAFGVGMLISGGITVLYYEKEHFKDIFKNLIDN